MLSQNQPDVNTLLHGMRVQIAALTRQLTELQASPPAATPLVEKKFNKKVKVIADPRTFEGDRAQFAKWWIKLQIWVKANWDVFADNFENAGVWPVWDDLKVEIKKCFKPQAECDWARQQICSFKQANIRTDDYITRFLALSIQGGLGNEHAVELLECNVNPRIAEQIYLQDTQNENLALAAEEVRRVGRDMELYAMHQGGGTTTKNTYSQRSPGSSNQNKQHSHGFKPYGLQPGQGAPMDISTVQGGQKRRFTGNCYNCGKLGHMSWQCKNGAQAAQQKNNQGHQVRQLEAEKPDNWLNSLAGCSYNKIRAFFYDQQVAEMKAQGKEFGV
ncbi:hypothetical protein SERLA73DRAFT_73680 [Serpula lacrymans var. lacrymans S7.3]|uniref:CCHC-type domain-containing protein n=1 Tax=Serpula lacrymans var. lacrymans (strain S7.3) TaxID=936435 RepID=F8PZ11_SERL3|nr:hypothetical protein SERLA73DRAFT_73680 [Serpula lacrymans var. lacrymans S7.3]